MKDFFFNILKAFFSFFPPNILHFMGFSRAFFLNVNFLSVVKGHCHPNDDKRHGIKYRHVKTYENKDRFIN